MTDTRLEIAVVQCELQGSRDVNVSRVEALVREAAGRGARIVLTPELFEARYFPQAKDANAFDLAAPAEGHPTIQRMQRLAKELAVVLPVSFFEKADDGYYNSLAVVDADGAELGVYRKSHIPHGPGYEEKFYFRPGNTGFRVWDTRHGRLGIGVCWDQWFPETARAMALLGAEVLLYPTAIGTEPTTPDEDSKDPWRRVMLGHAVANAMPLAAANRIGTEAGLTFYGSSFICDHRGEVIAELDRHEEGIAVATFDRDALREYRANWDFFRDRRPDLYGVLSSNEPVE
ncbi:MAG: N-carbamoylputrescine amidase [Myxococcales bacterium]|nr:N-carbamoylputrescine amidase [Myxococcales bacterium]MDH3483479.1 N-carbamoylputrescine amidase [Myxococcales bacterium]